MSGRRVHEDLRPGKPIRPSEGLRVAYRRRLTDLVDAMEKSVVYWLSAEWKRQQGKITAYDASPAVALTQALRKRMARWKRRFGESSAPWGHWFADQAEKSASAAVGASIAGVTGITVRWQATRAMNNAVQSIVAENVALIKSLPEKLAPELEGIIMRSVRSGRDLSGVVEDLHKRFEVARHRAAFIAEDQTNKASEALSRVRMQEMGIDRAEWVHVTRSIDARATHKNMDGRSFYLSEGMFDPGAGRRIQPGELPRCRCTKRPLIPAFVKSQRDLQLYEEADFA